MVQNIYKILVVVGPTSSSWFPNFWSHHLTQSTIGRFKRLESLCLLVCATPTHRGHDFPSENIMDNPQWQDNGLVSIVTAFQQHKLRPNLTRIGFGTEKLSEAIREELLKDRPAS